MSSYRRYLDEKRDPKNSTNPRSNLLILEDLYRPEYCTMVHEELDYLLRVYGTQFRLGKAHPAPCSTWRAERSLQDTLTDWEARFAKRVHLFAGARHLFGGSDKDYVQEQPRRYLGYVSLRPLRYKKEPSIPTYLSYTTVAMLIPPPYMLRPRYHIITCIVGSTDGILPFRSAPFFSPPSPNKGNPSAPCMHASLHAALMLKATLFHCRPISSMEMVTLLWEMDHDADRVTPIRSSKDANRPLSFSEWLEKGLSLEQALAVIKHPAVRGGGIVENITDSFYLASGSDKQGKKITDAEKAAKRKQVALETLRCLTDYLASGIPVILEVTPKESEITAHAVLLIGLHLMADPDEVRWPIPDDSDEAMKRIDVKELPSKFVIHDTLRGPYELVTASYLLDKAHVKQDDEGKEGIRFLAVLPIGARIGVQKVRDYVRTEISDKVSGKLNLLNSKLPPPRQTTYQDYLEEQIGEPLPTNAVKTMTEPRFVCRLIRSRQIIHRYLRSGGEKPELPGGIWPKMKMANLEAAKTKMGAYVGDFQKRYEEQVLGLLKTEINEPNGTIDPVALHWWCVEVRVPEQIKIGLPKNNEENGQGVPAFPPFVVYCWPVNWENEDDSDAPIKIEYETGDQAVLTLRGSPTQDEVRLVFDQWRPSDG